MNFELVISPEAGEDIQEAFNWHEDIEVGLGLRFLESLEHAYAKLLINPHYQTVFNKTRHFVALKPFRHSIFYTLSENVITITACIHDSRDPKIWKSRS